MAKRETVTSLHGPVYSKGHEYWYAWRGRGAPQISKDGHPAYGSPDFWAAYDAAVRDRHIPEPGKFKSLVTLYKSSAAYKDLGSTKNHWGPWLDKITDHFGALSIAAFELPRVRKSIRQWRAKYEATPRTADMGMQVLSRICSYAVRQGRLSLNPCEGIEALYSSDRSDKIWTDADIAQIKEAGSPEVGHAIDLAATSGLRRGDLLRASWSHVHEHEIVIPTNKSKRRIEARIPLYAELREVLARIPKCSTTILTNSLGRPWTDDGFGTVITKAKAKAGIGPDLHFNDLRGTAATRFYVAGLDKRVIAEILGWTEGSVENIIRRYVGRDAATKAVIKQLDEARARRAEIGEGVTDNSSVTSRP